jgi:hypothetical protein
LSSADLALALVLPSFFIPEESHPIPLALGHEVTALSLERCRTRYRCNDAMAWWNKAVISLAGAPTEQRYARYPRTRWQWMRRPLSLLALFAVLTGELTSEMPMVRSNDRHCRWLLVR